MIVNCQVPSSIRIRLKIRCDLPHPLFPSPEKERHDNEMVFSKIYGKGT